MFGFIPLLAYTIEELVDFVDFDNTFFAASSMTATAFIVIGLLKSRVAKTSAWRSISETLLLGIIAAIAAYAIGGFIERIIS